MKKSENYSLRDDRQRTKNIILIVIAVIPLLYVSGFLAQLMDNYTAWSDAGGVPGDGTSPKLPDRSIVICLLSIFSITGLKAVLAMAGAVAVLLFLIWYRDRENSKGYDRERKFSLFRERDLWYSRLYDTGRNETDFRRYIHTSYNRYDPWHSRKGYRKYPR